MTSQWQFQPIFGSYVLASALIATLLLLLMVRPAFGQLSRSRRRWLNILRAALAVLLLLAMLRPTYIRTEKRTQTAQLLLLFDISRSMEHADGEGGKTRWEQQLSLLRSSIPKLNNMGDNFAVSCSDLRMV